jgi:hypothetical protein
MRRVLRRLFASERASVFCRRRRRRDERRRGGRQGGKSGEGRHLHHGNAPGERTWRGAHEQDHACSGRRSATLLQLPTIRWAAPHAARPPRLRPKRSGGHTAAAACLCRKPIPARAMSASPLGTHTLKNRRDHGPGGGLAIFFSVAFWARSNTLRRRRPSAPRSRPRRSAAPSLKQGSAPPRSIDI